MNQTRAWSFGAAVVAVLLVIAAWFVAISPQRSEAADLRDQTTAQQQSNEQLKLKTKQLQAQFASLPERQAQLAEIKQQMPDNPALPALIRDLSSHASTAGVTLVSVSPGEPVPATPAAPVAPGAPAAGSTATARGGQLLSIPTEVVASGSYADLTLYLQRLQTQMRRAVLIEGIELTPLQDQNTTKGPLSMKLTGQIFVLDSAAPAAAGGVTAPVAPTTSTSAS
jgi:Tfp pilus assembly protein PilO